jgi:hypothetical protein
MIHGAVFQGDADKVQICGNQCPSGMFSSQWKLNAIEKYQSHSNISNISKYTNCPKKSVTVQPPNHKHHLRHQKKSSQHRIESAAASVS